MSEGLIGVILGSLMGLFSSLASQKAVFKQEEKTRLQNKKEDIYIKAIKLLTDFDNKAKRSNEGEGTTLPESVMKNFDDLIPELLLYASEEAYDILLETLTLIINSEGNNNREKILDKRNEFTKLVFDDLKIDYPSQK